MAKVSTISCLLISQHWKWTCDHFLRRRISIFIIKSPLPRDKNFSCFSLLLPACLLWEAPCCLSWGRYCDVDCTDWVLLLLFSQTTKPSLLISDKPRAFPIYKTPTSSEVVLETKNSAFCLQVAVVSKDGSLPSSCSSLNWPIAPRCVSEWPYLEGHDVPPAVPCHEIECNSFCTLILLERTV